MQDTLDITDAGYEYDLTWFYTLKNGYSILVHLTEKQRSTQGRNQLRLSGGA